MEDKYNIHDFISKIDWEGGVYGALEYGLTARDYDLPKHLVDSWNEIRELFEDIDSLVSEWYRESEKHANTVPFGEE
jgi:hypothetical protein